MTVRGRRVIAWIPYGRERTVSILLAYLLREHAKGVVDEIWLCENTGPAQESDRAYAQRMADEYGPVIQIKPRPGTPGWRSHVTIGSYLGDPSWEDGPRHPIQLNTGRFPIYMQDPDAVYVRLDDDIVFVQRDAIRHLVEREIDRPEVLGSFPIIYNNAICSNLLQRHGVIPLEWGIVRAHCVDPIGWGDPYFAEKLHTFLLDTVEAGDEEKLKIEQDYTLGMRTQFSVSGFAIRGSEYAVMDGVLDWDEEEHWLTMHRTGVIGKPNAVIGGAVISHLSFFTQRDYLLNHTNLLDRYRALSEVYA